MRTDYRLLIQTHMDQFSKQGFRANTEAIRTNLESLHAAMSQFRLKVEDARASGKYTEAGLRSISTDAAREAKGKLDAFRREHVSVLEKRIQDERAAMKPKAQSSESEVVRYLRQREIRDLLRGMDSLEAYSACIECIDKPGFSEVLDAIESAPTLPGKPLMKVESLNKLRDLRLQRENPENCAAIAELAFIKEMYNALLVPADNEISEVLGSEDKIRDTRTGGPIRTGGAK